MKRVIFKILLLISLFALSQIIFTSKVRAFSGAGSGTSGSPFQITTCSQLQEMNNAKSSFYKIMNPIDCTATVWTPVGTSGLPFTGTLDGNNQAITNLTITNKIASGVFAYTSGATISNVNLTVAINMTTGSNFVDVGGLTGNMNGGSITNSVTAGTLTNSGFGNSSNFGGMVGSAYGTAQITSSHSSVAINYTGSGFVSAVGGFAGLTNGTANIQDSYATGNITTSTPQNFLGGFVGDQEGGSTMLRDYATGTIDSDSSGGTLVSGSSQLGGFVGLIGLDNTGTPTITSCHATGDVKGGGTFAEGNGGFVGEMDNKSQISGSYATGAVSMGLAANDAQQDGGFVGLMRNTSGSSTPSVTGSYSTGTVSGGDTSSMMGGFVGELRHGTITTSYSTGPVNVGLTAASFSGPIGGFVGQLGWFTLSASISQSSSSGTITSTSDGDGMGGFVGNLNWTSSITDAYSRGNVTVTGATTTDDEIVV